MRPYTDYVDPHVFVNVQWDDREAKRTVLTMVQTPHGIVVAIAIDPLAEPVRYSGQTYLYYAMGRYTYTRVFNFTYRGEYLAKLAKAFSSEIFRKLKGSENNDSDQ